MISTPPAAVLFDMDGTLVDTEPYWMAAETELIARWGGVWTTEDAMSVVGAGLPVAARLFQARGVELGVDQVIDELTDRVLEQIEARVPWRPGAAELLSAVRAAGIPTALVTMSIGRMAQRVVDALPTGSFSAVVTGEQVRSKPDPEPYLRAAELLGVDPADAVAIEDSEPGVASAVAAGTTVIAVPLHVPLPESPAYTLWIRGLEGRGLDDVSAVHAARTGRAA